MRTRPSIPSIEIVMRDSTPREKGISKLSEIRDGLTLGTNFARCRRVTLAQGSQQYTGQAHRWHVGSACHCNEWHAALSYVGKGKTKCVQAMCGRAASETSGSWLYPNSPLKLHQGIRLLKHYFDRHVLTLRNGRNAMSKTALLWACHTELCRFPKDI